MTDNLRERGEVAFRAIAEEHLTVVVRWLELLAKMEGQSDVESEEMWLLASGALEQMNDEADGALKIADWRKYLDAF